MCEPFYSYTLDSVERNEYNREKKRKGQNYQSHYQKNECNKGQEEIRTYTCTYTDICKYVGEYRI